MVPTTPRTAITPNPLYGWNPARHTVEVERVSARGDLRAIDAVYVNGKHVGHVIGRTSGRRREWDHVVGTDAPSSEALIRLVYPTTERQHALVALVEHTS